MAMNRLTRDDILKRALDLADSAVLDAKDRPAGTIVSTALSIGWLQEALDIFHKKFPFSSNIATSAVSLVVDTTTIAVPSDFILDFKDGIILANDKGRLVRRSLSAILNRQTTTKGRPTIYAVVGSTIHFWPKADETYSGTLYYYKLPTVLAAATVPSFPDDLILVEYVWIKAQEWHRVKEPGSALAYANQVIGELQKAGIGNEAEEDQFSIDPAFVTAVPADPNDWMGNPNL